MKSFVLSLKLEEHERRRTLFFNNFLYIFLFIITFFFFNTPSFGQCEMEFEYEAESCSKGGKDGKIYIRSISAHNSLEFKLFDLRKAQFVDSKTYNSLDINNRVLVFNNLPSSNYIVEVRKTDCEAVQIGEGISGILIGIKE